MRNPKTFIKDENGAVGVPGWGRETKKTWRHLSRSEICWIKEFLTSCFSSLFVLLNWRLCISAQKPNPNVLQRDLTKVRLRVQTLRFKVGMGSPRGCSLYSKELQVESLDRGLTLLVEVRWETLKSRYGTRMSNEQGVDNKGQLILKVYAKIGSVSKPGSTVKG